MAASSRRTTDPVSPGRQPRGTGAGGTGVFSDRCIKTDQAAAIRPCAKADQRTFAAISPVGGAYRVNNDCRMHPCRLCDYKKRRGREAEKQREGAYEH